MKYRDLKCIILLLSFSMLVSFNSKTEKASKEPIYLNTAYSFEERAADLVSRMTLEEKQSLLGNTMPAIPRLGINSYNVWGEALHGIASYFNPYAKPSTSFPNSVALGSAWDPQLAERETSAIAEEGRGGNAIAVNGLTYWSPVVEPVRDPRWGRTGESFGEDPFLISRVAGGFVRGMMGNDPTYYKTVPTAKHYFANNSEFNRHTGSSDMDDRDMREFYLAPYKTLIEKDKVPSIMTAYSAVNGIPVTASQFLVDTIARRTYGLDGYVTSDCGGVGDIETGHHYAKSNAEAAAMGLKAGVDSNCGSVYQTGTIDALKEGLITEAEIDKALVNVFVIRMKTGEFDPKSKVPYALIQEDVINSPAHIALAEEVATKTPVLLKNNVVEKTNKKALPINAGEIKKIALFGPHADKVELGPYSGATVDSNMISPLEGIGSYLSEVNPTVSVAHSNGANTLDLSNLLYVQDFELIKADGSSEKVSAAEFDEKSSAEITKVSTFGGAFTVRNIKDGDWTSYENIDISNIESMSVNVTIPGAGGAIDVRVGSPTGNLLASFEARGKENSEAFGGLMRGPTTVTSKVSKLGISGKQTIYLVYHTLPPEAIDEETLALASSSDVAVVFVGTDEKTATEESDRQHLLLPGNQYQLIEAIAGVNPNTVVVMQTLGMVEVDQFKDLPNVKGIIWTGFNGQAQGAAMAKILFGDVNPGGKLNATWYKSLDDIPPITDYTLRGGPNKNGRTYWYFNKDVSYEFGFGLSYTTFDYSNFKISKSQITPNDKITVSVDVKNTGDVNGDEVVQVYMRTPDSPASLQRPIKRLKGFKRVTIPAGQIKTVSIDIDCADLWFWDDENNRITFDQGNYVFEVGSSSQDIKGTVDAKMAGSYKSVLKTVVADCGKIVLNEGNKVKTSVTAAMSDDSFYDINKATVRFKSNNPDVLTVDRNGLVTATGPGVATIKASVTVEGNTVSDSYALKVMPNLTLESVMLDGQKIKTFNPAIKGYSYLLKEGAKAPVVSAVQSVDDISIDIQQAESVPGSALITLKDNTTVAESKYVVDFGTKGTSDEFKNSTLGNQWKWVRENQENWSLEKSPGELVITGNEGAISGTSNNAENILLQSANSNWTIETEVVFSQPLSKPGQQGGIMSYQDDDNYVKLVYVNATKGFMGSSQGIELLVEADGSEFSAANLSFGQSNPFRAEPTAQKAIIVKLKLVKEGSKYTAYYSTDGKGYKFLGSTEAVLANEKAGLIVCNGPGFASGSLMGMFGRGGTNDTPLNVAFKYFRIKNTGPK